MVNRPVSWVYSQTWAVISQEERLYFAIISGPRSRREDVARQILSIRSRDHNAAARILPARRQNLPSATVTASIGPESETVRIVSEQATIRS